MRTRVAWRYCHLSVGLACSLFLLVSGASGAVLMFGPEIDRLLHPDLYAAHQGPAQRPLTDYLAVAAAAVPSGKPVAVRWPGASGRPLTVLFRLRDERGPRDAAANDAENDRPQRDAGMRSAGRPADDQQNNGREPRREGAAERPGTGQPGIAAAGRGRPRLLMAYLDPVTATLLGTADPRGGVVGWVRSLHTDLRVPMFAGRQIVGWAGLGLSLLSLTGLYLWWPRHASLRRGLRWRRSPKATTNLHHLGFWVAAPLALMGLTGAYQAFPQQGRALIGLFAPVSQGARQGFGAAVPTHPRLLPQQAVDLATSGDASQRLAALMFPTRGAEAWRVQRADGEQRTVIVDDATAAVSLQPLPPAGDAFQRFMRRLHEGRDFGPLWTAVVLLTGLALPMLPATGMIMWLRRRRAEAGLRRLKVAGPRAVATAAQ